MPFDSNSHSRVDWDGSDRQSDSNGGTTRRTLLKTTGAGLGALAVAGLGATGTVSAATPRLHTDGKWIRDPDGNAVTLRGVSPSGLNYLEQTHPKSITEVLGMATADDWHTDVIRLPVTEWAVHDYGMDYVVNDLLRPAVDFLADQGVYAAIDFHLIRPYVEVEAHAEGMVADGWAETKDGLGFKWDVPTDDLLRDFWGAVAPEFADDEHVVFELFNEPTLPNWWSTYGSAADDVNGREDSWLLWRDTAQPWVDLIRDNAPETPIIIGSPDWTSETQFAPAHPFTGDNLIYSGHIYPENGQPSEFDSEYGAPANDVPVIISEFGWDPDEEFSENVEYRTTTEWGEPFREWADSYDNMGWFAWAFDDTWAPSMFDSPGDGAGEPWTLKDNQEQHGWFIKQWLADYADGGSGGGGSEDTTAPTAPSNLSQSGASTSSVDLSWSAASDTGGSGLNYYNVYVDGTVDQQVSAGTTAATVSGLSGGMDYDFSVTAVDGAGNESAASNTVTASTSSDSGGGGGAVSVQRITLTDTTKWNNCEYSLEYELSSGSGVDHVEVTFADQTNTWANGTKSSSSTPVGTVSFSAGGTEDDTYEITVEALDGSGSVLVSQTITDVADGSNTEWTA
jgi:hypothetical protein